MIVPTESKKTDERHREFRSDALAVISKHTASLPFDEMLAVSAQLTGCLIAMLDQNEYTYESAIAVSDFNIEIGRSEMVNNILSPKGTA